jgi:hypothetical protein
MGKDLMYVLITMIIIFGTFLLLDISDINLDSGKKNHLVKKITIESF